MNQNFTLPEMQAALRISRITPAPASPLADLQLAANLDNTVMESLRQKGIWDGAQNLSGEWRRTLETLANPSQQATVHVEGVAAANYFSGAGGIAAMVPIENEQQKILGQLSIDTILTETDVLMGWQAVPDGPPLQFELSIEELTTIASIADARREEHLRAVLERREPVTGKIIKSDAERQVTQGQSHPDSRWLISILDRYAPEGCRPVAAALDAGASALIGRDWAKAGEGCLELGPDLEILCDGFSNVFPFLAVGVGAPWSEKSVALFTRGWQSFWGIEFHSGEGRNGATLSRLGAEGMEEKLRRLLAAFAPQSAQAPGGQAPAAAAGSGWQVTPPSPASASNLCQACGKELKPGKKFCTSCGTPVP